MTYYLTLCSQCKIAEALLSLANNHPVVSLEFAKGFQINAIQGWILELNVKISGYDEDSKLNTFLDIVPHPNQWDNHPLP